jgi:hypothetical protein
MHKPARRLTPVGFSHRGSRRLTFIVVPIALLVVVMIGLLVMRSRPLLTTPDGPTGFQSFTTVGAKEPSNGDEASASEATGVTSSAAPRRHRPVTPSRAPAIPHGAVATVHVDFAMSEEFTKAWRTSDKRLSFDTTMSFTGRDARGATVPSATQTDVRVRITFYGKSSLKIKYTRRRSVQVDVIDTNPSAGLRLPNAGLGTPLRTFLLLSLWEDTYRIAYRSSTVLLQDLGIFFAANRLVALSCDGDKSLCGDSLGAYLALEYPSDAIRRAVESVGIDSIAPQFGRCRSPLLPQGAAETAMQKASASDPGQVEIGTRNWFYYEKPPIYDLLHVPSYKRNSTLSQIYRAIEIDPIQGANAKGGGLFDVDKYFAWIATNTLLQNGDYDDEVFLYRANGYISIMAWDYDNVFSACHRKGERALRTSTMFCAETPIEKLVLNTPSLRQGYFGVAACLMANELSPAKWKTATAIALKELEDLFASSNGDAIRRATWNEVSKDPKRFPDPVAGAAKLRAEYQKRWNDLAAALPPGSVPNIATGDSVDTASEKPRAPLPTSGPSKSASRAGQQKHVASCSAKAASSLTASLKSWVKHEYKGSAALDKPPAVDGVSDAAFTLVGPSGPIAGFTAPISEAGLFCAKASSDSEGCAATRLSVIRSTTRGKAEFAVAHFKPKPFVEIVDEAPLRAHLTGLRVLAPTGFWPADVPIPIVVRLVGANEKSSAPGWLRANAFASVEAVKTPKASGVASANDGGDEAGDKAALASNNAVTVPIVRGFSAFLVTASAEIAEKAAAVAMPGTSAVVRVASRVKTLKVQVQSGVGTVKLPDTWHVNAKKTVALPADISSDLNIAPTGGVCVATVHPDGSTIHSGVTVAVAAGCTLIVPPSAVLTVHGKLVVEGTAQQPASIAPTKASSLFDTILVSGRSAQVLMTFTFVTGSGAGTPRADATGHHHTASAAITAINGATVKLTQCFFVYLVGSSAIAAGDNARVTMEHSLVQYAKQGIECVACDFTCLGSVFTHFANKFNADYEDEDNDAMYLSGGTHRVHRSVIANTHDDGIDTGTPEEKTPQGKSRDGGSLHVDETIIESIAHEGIALSSAPKASRIVSVTNALVQNAQQGIEVGYSGEGHDAAVSGTMVRNCGTGIRYGDNYHNRGVAGKIAVTDGVLTQNRHDYLNYVRQTSSPKPSSYIHFTNVKFMSPVLSEAEWPCQDVFNTMTRRSRVAGDAAEEDMENRIERLAAGIVAIPKSADDSP